MEEKKKTSKSTEFANRLLCVVYPLQDCVQTEKQLIQTIRTTSTSRSLDCGWWQSWFEWLMLMRKKKIEEKKRDKHTHTPFLCSVWISKRVCFVNQFNCCLIINYCFEVFLVRCERFPNWRLTRKHTWNGIHCIHSIFSTEHTEIRVQCAITESLRGDIEEASLRQRSVSGILVSLNLLWWLRSTKNTFHDVMPSALSA